MTTGQASGETIALRVVERWFHVREKGTTVKREILAGLTTFLTMAYIIFVQPAVLSAAGMDFGAVLGATCFSSALATGPHGLSGQLSRRSRSGHGSQLFLHLHGCFGHEGTLAGRPRERGDCRNHFHPHGGNRAA